jgi:hypothetical protein
MSSRPSVAGRSEEEMAMFPGVVVFVMTVAEGVLMSPMVAVFGAVLVGLVASLFAHLWVSHMMEASERESDEVEAALFWGSEVRGVDPGFDDWFVTDEEWAERGSGWMVGD